MLFALIFDRLVFGHSPDLMSVAGSTLILGSAIYVAMMVNAGKNGTKEQTEGSSSVRETDEEAGQGLISGTIEPRNGERYDGIRRSMEEVQLRTLR